jgi:Cupin
VQVADSNNFKVATTVAATLVTMQPGAMRQMHWHPNADEIMTCGQRIHDRVPNASPSPFNETIVTSGAGDHRPVAGRAMVHLNG